MKKTARQISLMLCFVLTASSCSTPGPLRQYGAEDHYGRYYETNDGKLLRVTPDGHVWDISCVKFEKARDRAIDVLKGEVYCHKDKRIEDLGQVSRDGDEWDMSNFGISPESGTCKPLWTTEGWEKRRSCWYRIWEIPASIVVTIPVLVTMIALAPLGWLVPGTVPNQTGR